MPAILDHPTPNWYALRVAARSETKIADALRRKGYEVYLPLRTVLKQYSDRVKKSQVALLSGIVFCRFAEREWIKLIKTPGVMAVVEFERKLAPVPERELAVVRCLADSPFPIDEEQGLASGEAAEIMTDIGPLPCLILASGELCRIAIRLEFLDQQVVLKIPRAEVQRKRD